jgi:Golgi SNAP receptor complex protein 1
MASYDALRRQCRTLENQIDNKLSSYARIGTSDPDDLESGLVSQRRQDLETELSDLLNQVSLYQSGDILSPTWLL